MSRFFPVLLVLLLSACSTVTPLPTEDATPQQHQESLKDFQHWFISGRAAIQNGYESWHVNLLWLQQAEDYQIRLFGPFGSGQVQLAGNAGRAELSTSEDERYIASDADQLLYERTGVRMPVNELRYWLIGRHSPKGHDQARYDRHGRLTSLQQGEWHVQYKAYKAVNGLVLPSKIFAQKDDVDVRLVIDQWQLGATAKDNPFNDPA